MRPGARGYTILEVMMALATLAVGAVGVIALQNATLVGNVNARNLATANAVALTWIERLNTDASTWTDANGVPNIGGTTWLGQVAASNAPWFIPLEVVTRGSPKADVLGADIFANDPAPLPSVAFCTELRLTRLLPAAVRADVRVYWSKAGNALTDCVAGNAATAENADYGYVYVASTIYKTTASN